MRKLIRLFFCTYCYNTGAYFLICVGILLLTNAGEGYILILTIGVLTRVKTPASTFTFMVAQRRRKNDEIQSFSEKKRHRGISEEIRDRCAERHGAGAVLFPADRYDHQHHRHPVRDSLSEHGRRFCHCHVRTCHGHRHRLCPESAQPGAVLAGCSRRRSQYAGRSRRPSCRTGNSHSGG